MWCKRTQLIKSFGSSWPRFIIGPLNGSSLNHFISYVKVRRLLGNEKVISLKLTIIFCNLLHNFFLVKSINRKFNRNHLKGAKNWIRQVENLTDRYDYTLLMECSENYVCEVCNLKSNKNNSYFTQVICIKIGQVERNNRKVEILAPEQENSKWHTDSLISSFIRYVKKT